MSKVLSTLAIDSQKVRPNPAPTRQGSFKGIKQAQAIKTYNSPQSGLPMLTNGTALSSAPKKNINCFEFNDTGKCSAGDQCPFLEGHVPEKAGTWRGQSISVKRNRVA